MASPQVDFGRLAGVLFLVCLSAAALLAVVNSKTEPIIQAIAAEKAVLARKSVLPAGTAKVDDGEKSFQVSLAADFEANRTELRGVLGDDQEKSLLIEVFRGYDKGDKVTGYAFECELPDGYSGMIRFMVGVSWDDELGAFRVGGSKVLKHAETPGLGANIEAISYDEKVAARKESRDPIPDFLKQYQGLKAEELRLKKEDPPGPIDALTAATITSKAYTQALRRVVAMCNRNADLFRNPRPPPAPETGGEGSSHGE